MKHIAALLVIGVLLAPGVSQAYSAVEYSKPLYTLPNNQFAAAKTGAGKAEYFTCSSINLQCQSTQDKAQPPVPELVGIPFVASSNDKVFLGKFKTNDQTTYKLFTSTGKKVVSRTLSYVTDSTQMHLNEQGSEVLFVLADGSIEVVNTKTSKILKKVQLPNEAKRVFYLNFSPTGRYAAYFNQSDSYPGPRGYVVIDFSPATPTIYSWTQDVGVRDLLFFQSKIFDFSPDEKTLYFMNDADGYAEVYGVLLPLKNVSAQASEVGHKLDFTSGESSYFLATKNYVYVTANTKENPGQWDLYRWSTTGKSKLDKLADGVSQYVPLVLSGGAGILFQAYGTKPGIASKVDVKTKKVTQVNIPTSSPTIPQAKVIQASPYGVTLALPDGYQTGTSYPVVVWLHGGPYRQVVAGMSAAETYGRFDYMMEQLRKHGVVVVKADYPGSSGYGKQSYQSLWGGVGKTDVSSIMDTLQLVGKQVKMDKVYLMGISYGGYLSLKTAVEYPESLTGIIAVSPVTDWKTTLTDPTDASVQFFGGLATTTNDTQYQQADISSKVNKFTNKQILFAIGDKDTTVDQKIQSTVLSGSLTAAGISNTLKVFKDEGHVFNQTADLQALCSASLSLVSGKEQLCE